MLSWREGFLIFRGFEGWLGIGGGVVLVAGRRSIKRDHAGHLIEVGTRVIQITLLFDARCDPVIYNIEFYCEIHHVPTRLLYRCRAVPSCVRNTFYSPVEKCFQRGLLELDEDICSDVCELLFD